MLEPAHDFVGQRLSREAIFFHALQPPLDPPWNRSDVCLGVRATLLDQAAHLRHRRHGETGAADVERFQRVDLPTSFQAEHVLARHAHTL